MDQARLPGVGNIIKCEGLFGAGIHPLRRASELDASEWERLIEELRSFSNLWYAHCTTSYNGQLMGCCHLMRIYGHWTCCVCRSQISLIKEGTRQRITYFCPRCQPSGIVESRCQPHRREIHLALPLCKCGELPAVLQCRAGNYCADSDDRRAYLSCSNRRGSNYDDGGCGLRGKWDGCGLYQWLDEVAELPQCKCRKPSQLRRVVGLRENGRFFLRCADRHCRFRCWLQFAGPSTTIGCGRSVPYLCESDGQQFAGNSTAIVSSAPRWRRREHHCLA